MIELSQLTKRYGQFTAVVDRATGGRRAILRVFEGGRGG